MKTINNSQNQASEQLNAAQGSNQNNTIINNNEVMITEESSTSEQKNAVCSEVGAEPTTVAPETITELNPQDSVEEGTIAEDATPEAAIYKPEMVSVDCKKSLSPDSLILYGNVKSIDALIPDSSFVLSYEKAIRTGNVKVAYLKCNRDIQKAHVKDLIKLAKGSGKKAFDEEAICVSAADVLKVNETEPDEKKRIHLVDEDGIEIDLDTIDISSFVVILDGQHRVVACSVCNEIDLKVRLVSCPPSPDAIRQYVKNINTSRRAWSTYNHIKSNAESGKTNGSLATQTEVLSSFLKVSKKYAQELMFFQKDHIRKATALSGKEGDLNDTHISRVRTIGKALILLVKDNKFARKVDFLDAITSYFTNNKTDDHFNRDVSCFLANMTDTQKTTFQTMVDEKNYGATVEYFRVQFDDFCSAHKGDMDDVYLDAEARIYEAWNKRSDEIRVAAKKSGTAAEISKSFKKTSK